MNFSKLHTLFKFYLKTIDSQINFLFLNFYKYYLHNYLQYLHVNHFYESNDFLKVFEKKRVKIYVSKTKKSFL